MAKLDTYFRVTSPAYFHNAGPTDAAGLLGFTKITTVADFGPPVVSGTRAAPFVVERTVVVPDVITTAVIDMTGTSQPANIASIVVAGAGTIGVEVVAGAWTGTLVFEDSLSGLTNTWDAVSGEMKGSGKVLFSSTTGGGRFTFVAAGKTLFRVRSSAAGGTGTATVNFGLYREAARGDVTIVSPQGKYIVGSKLANAGPFGPNNAAIVLSNIASARYKLRIVLSAAAPGNLIVQIPGPDVNNTPFVLATLAFPANTLATPFTALTMDVEVGVGESVQLIPTATLTTLTAALL